MLIRPIDAQVMVNKSTEISKYQSNMQDKYNLVGYMQAENMQNIAETKTRKVLDKENVQKAMIREKQERNSKKEEKRNKYKNGKENPRRLGEEHHQIDVRL